MSNTIIDEELKKIEKLFENRIKIIQRLRTTIRPNNITDYNKYKEQLLASILEEKILIENGVDTLGKIEFNTAEDIGKIKNIQNLYEQLITNRNIFFNLKENIIASYKVAINEIRNYKINNELESKDLSNLINVVRKLKMNLIVNKKAFNNFSKSLHDFISLSISNKQKLLDCKFYGSKMRSLFLGLILCGLTIGGIIEAETLIKIFITGGIILGIRGISRDIKFERDFNKIIALQKELTM